MSVLITFEPAGLNGLVAEGTYLIDAAKRMGVALGSGCTGNGECPSCLVLVTTGVELLSLPTLAERNVLGVAGLAKSHRLACQVMIERTGEIVVNVASNKEKTGNPSGPDLRKEFGQLSLEKKIAMLLQFEAVTMSEAFDAAIEKPLALGARALDVIARRARSARTHERHKKQPPEHQEGES